MHRNNLIALLNAYHPTDREEILSKKTILEFVHAYPDCFERTQACGHITASAWLLSADHEHALLMHHAKLDMWVQVGGHCDGDPDVRAVALKEAREESGISQITIVSPAIFDIDVHLIPDRPNEKAHYHYDIRFLLAVGGDEKITQNSESKELRWISKDPTKLPTQSRSIMRMFHKWCAYTQALHTNRLTQSQQIETKIERVVRDER